MVCYHIQLNENVSNLCTTILAWGRYHQIFLLMGVRKPPDILKHKMTGLFQGF